MRIAGRKAAWSTSRPSQSWQPRFARRLRERENESGRWLLLVFQNVCFCFSNGCKLALWRLANGHKPQRLVVRIFQRNKTYTHTTGNWQRCAFDGSDSHTTLSLQHPQTQQANMIDIAVQHPCAVCVSHQRTAEVHRHTNFFVKRHVLTHQMHQCVLQPHPLSSTALFSSSCPRSSFDRLLRQPPYALSFQVKHLLLNKTHFFVKHGNHNATNQFTCQN